MQSLLLRTATAAAALLPFLLSAAPLSLQSALDLAVQRSEARRSALAGVASATQAARAAGELPDPALRVGVDNLPVTGSDRLSTTRDSMTMKRIGVSQEWVSRDKRVAREAAAEASVRREEVQVQAAVAEVRLQTALAYLDAFYAGEALKLTTLMEHHAHEEVEAARARFASSTGSSQEVLTVGGLRGVAEDDSADVRQQLGTARVALRRWVGLDAEFAEELTPPPEISTPSEEAYVAAHPSVALMRGEVGLAQRAAAVAASNRNPNWSWELSYGQRTGYSDMLSVGVTIPLPIARGARQDRETAAKLALVDKAEADLAEAARAAAAEYQTLLSDAQRLQERIERYGAAVLIPAQQRISVALAAYRSNQAGLTTLFEARHAEVEAQRKRLALKRELAKAQARLSFKSITPGAQP